ncbi:MAG TPA: iron-sulfur cluster insertion protein ErpA [Polyangiaceae bacterium]|nr:iron-sulfur cluster insertion protein ErpA [Polyangiaceae bacterium]
MISITQLAADKVKEISSSEGLAGQGLRLRVIGGGCAGFQYDLYFEENPTEFDEQFESNGVQLFVDPLSYQYLDGTEIDYVDGAHGSGFKFGNPNVTSTCGCGSSFKA